MGCMLSENKKPKAEVTPEQWNEEMHKKIYEFRADKLGEDVVRAECEEEKHRGRYHTTQKDLAPIMPLMPKTETHSLRYSAYRKSKLLENWVDDVTRVDSQIKIGEANLNLQLNETETDNKLYVSNTVNANCKEDVNYVNSSMRIPSDDKEKPSCLNELTCVKITDENNINKHCDDVDEQKGLKKEEDEEDSDCTCIDSNKCNRNSLSAYPIDSNNNENDKENNNANNDENNEEEKEERVTNEENERKRTSDDDDCTKKAKLDCVNGSRENNNSNIKKTSLTDKSIPIHIDKAYNNNNNNNEKNYSNDACDSSINNMINSCDVIQALPKVLLTYDTPVDDGTRTARATAASLTIKEICSEAYSTPLVASECEERKEEHVENKLPEKEPNEVIVVVKEVQIPTLPRAKSELNLNNTNSNNVTNLYSCGCSSNMLNELCHEECHKGKKVMMSEVAISNTTTRHTHTNKHDKHAFNNTLASSTSVHYDGNNQRTFVKEKHPRIVTDPPIVFLEPRWCKYSVDIRDPENCYTVEHKPKCDEVAGTSKSTSQTLGNSLSPSTSNKQQNGKQTTSGKGKVKNNANKDNKDKSINNSYDNNNNNNSSLGSQSQAEPLHSWYSESPSTESICATIRNTKPESLKSILKRT